MPSRSKKQHNAMAAAAAGDSTIGISESVGEKFIKHDKAAGKYGGKKKATKKKRK